MATKVDKKNAIRLTGVESKRHILRLPLNLTPLL